MSKQKFKIGDICKLKVGHLVWTNKPKKGVEWIDICPEYVGQEVYIEGSYSNLFGGDNKKDYQVMFLSHGGSSAWHHENELEFVRKGTLEEMGSIKDAFHNSGRMLK